MEHCLHCPTPPDDRPCRAVAWPHPRLCDLTDPGHPDHSAAYVRLLSGEPEPAPPAAAVRAATPAERPVAAAPDDWTAYRFPSPAARDRVNTCPYRECARGCQRSKCWAGRGDHWGQTTLEHCVACQTDGRLTLRAYLTSWTGYGAVAKHLGRGLDAAGIDFRFLDVHTDTQYLKRDPWVQERTSDERPEPGVPVLQLAVPFTRVPRNNPTVVFTMWESTRISRESVTELNHAKAVIVPCRWNLEGFRQSGVTVPIHVVPLGITQSEGFTPSTKKVPTFGVGTFFKYVVPPAPFTFGMSARMAHGGVRKGLNEGMAAFVKAYPNGEGVRLSVKVFPDCVPALKVPDDPRIEVVTEPYTTFQMADWFRSIDVLFVPSKSEGWGLNTQQAMACGKPVIAARYGGTAAFFDGTCGWELPYTEAPAGEFYTGLGDWCVPTEAGMVAALRSAHAESPDLVQFLGEQAARRAAEFTWERTGRELVEVLRGVKGFLKT